MTSKRHASPQVFKRAPGHVPQLQVLLVSHTHKNDMSYLSACERQASLYIIETITKVCRAASASASGKDSKELATILESKELNARQEAALLAHCSAEDKGLSVIAPTVDKIREDSMLAGLGVIAPNEIGTSKQSRWDFAFKSIICLMDSSNRGLF